MSLLPCPFCAAGETVSEADSKHWSGAQYQILSWHVRHWCFAKGDRFSSILTVRGKTQGEAETKWNTRTTKSEGAEPRNGNDI